jgi:hypothetical protein
MSEQLTIEQVRDWHRSEARKYTEYCMTVPAALHRDLANAIDANIAAESNAASNWRVTCNESDGRTWLMLTSPEGASAAVGCATRRGNGSETVQSQVLRYFAESFASCAK